MVLYFAPRLRRCGWRERHIHGLVILLQGYAGLYWLAPAILVSFAKAILDAWVLLVEIDR